MMSLPKSWFESERARVAHQLLDQEFRVEDVDAHRGEDRVRLAGQGL
jgi:hypothetical protein